MLCGHLRCFELIKREWAGENEYTCGFCKL